QALIRKRRPLVIMTPKSLLRLPAATSGLEDLTGGRFQPVLDDPSLPGAREDVERLVLCTGKLYYELCSHEGRETLDHVAIGRGARRGRLAFLSLGVGHRRRDALAAAGADRGRHEARREAGEPAAGALKHGRDVDLRPVRIDRPEDRLRHVVGRAQTARAARE